jgi:hypothetical protein
MNIKHIALLALMPVFLTTVAVTAQTKYPPNQQLQNDPPSPVLPNKQSTPVPHIGTGTGTVTLNSAALCYTCGGNFPIYAGTLPTSSYASEYGSSCGGSIGTTNLDTTPFLCTK